MPPGLAHWQPVSQGYSAVFLVLDGLALRDSQPLHQLYQRSRPQMRLWVSIAGTRSFMAKRPTLWQSWRESWTKFAQQQQRTTGSPLSNLSPPSMNNCLSSISNGLTPPRIWQFRSQTSTRPWRRQNQNPLILRSEQPLFLEKGNDVGQASLCLQVTHHEGSLSAHFLCV